MILPLEESFKQIFFGEIKFVKENFKAVKFKI